MFHANLALNSDEAYQRIKVFTKKKANETKNFSG
jgi:hypothetical protein